MTDKGEETGYRRRLAGAFGTGGAEYDRLRPGYPVEAVRWCLGEAPQRVADVGAGTGKLTRTLVELGHDVVAVEPSASMRAALAAALPGVAVVDGTGERSGLDTAAVDAVTFGQSWHWVDQVAGGAELARVLRPGGTVAMLWNDVDSGHGWVERIKEAMHDTPLAWDRERAGQGAETPAPVGPFAAVARDRVTWSDRVRVRDLVAQVTTRSYYLASDPHEQRRIVERVTAAVQRELPGVDEEEWIELPYVTRCLRYRLTGPGSLSPVCP